jgi:phosphoribosyl 1,2-cyclic phosphodiesterase
MYATPPSGQNEVVPPLKPINGDFASSLTELGHKEAITRDGPHSVAAAEEVITPLHCFGFRFGALVYISDVSAVPTAAWTHLRPPPAVLVLDCLRPDPHTSHFGIVQAVDHARKIGARTTLLTGFSHEVAHEEWERIMSAAEGARPGEDELSGMREVVRNAVSLVDEGQKVWIRPAFDGMKLWVEDGEVRFENA